MSNEVNTMIIEGLQARMTGLVEYLTPRTIAEFEEYINEGDLEAAEYLVSTLEAVYADDLI